MFFLIYLIKISFDLNTITKLQTVKEILFHVTLRLFYVVSVELRIIIVTQTPSLTDKMKNLHYY